MRPDRYDRGETMMKQKKAGRARARLKGRKKALVRVGDASLLLHLCPITPMDSCDTHQLRTGAHSPEDPLVNQGQAPLPTSSTVRAAQL